MKINIIRTLLLLFAFSQSSALFAENSSTCGKLKEEKIKYFESTAKAVKDVLDIICKETRFEKSEIDELIDSVLDIARNEKIASLGIYSDYVNDWLDNFYKLNSSDKELVLSFPRKRVLKQTDIIIKNGTKRVSVLLEKDYKSCMTEYGDCMTKFRNLSYLLNKLRYPFIKPKFDLVAKNILEKDAQWNRFINEGRPLSTLDICATNWFYDFKESSLNNFTAPPSKQFFFMRPSVVYEYADKSPNKDKFEEAVALEIFGVNWWNKSNACYGYACGLSLVATYSEYENLDNTGVGVMFHIENKYSFGITQRDDSDGQAIKSIFINIDLFKLFEKKEAQIDKWNNQLKDTLKDYKVTIEG